MLSQCQRRSDVRVKIYLLFHGLRDHVVWGARVGMSNKTI